MVRAENRDEYFPVYYVEPYAENAPALAFDLASDPTRKRAIDRLRRTLRPLSTGRIRLVQEEAEEFSVLFFVSCKRV